tara:strand:- start:72 stop:281 length:210 start_codon:yes stop_codon:yes gene_type:complete
MSEYEFIFWIVIAVMAFLAFGIWSADKLIENEKPTALQKRLEQINREADELVKQAHRKIDQRERLGDTK